jgi:hypothetical protein
MATARQIAANRLNSLRSTGPITDTGKAASRGNALTHGLTSEVIRPLPMVEAIAERRASWSESLGLDAASTDDANRAAWIVDVIATETVKLDRCQAELQALETRRAGAAATRWHDDARLAAEELALKLPRNPAFVARKLQASRHGCLLLIERWVALQSPLDDLGWTDDQRSHALDLLGVHPDFRTGTTAVDLSSGDLKSHRLALIADQIERLQGLIASSLESLDTIDREQAESGLSLLADKDARRIERYEKTCWTRFLWALRELRSINAPAKANAPAKKPADADRRAAETVASTRRLLECARTLGDLPAPIEPPLPPIRIVETAANPSRPLNRRQRRAIASMERRA